MLQISANYPVVSEETRGFVDNVLLVPNWDITKKNEKDKKKWLVQSQTFRLVL